MTDRTYKIPLLDSCEPKGSNNLTVNAKAVTVQGSILESSDTIESDDRQMEQR